MSRTNHDPRITAVVPMNDHLTHYRLCNGWFVSREKSALFRYDRDSPYEVWVPGGDERGCALRIGWARTLKGALAIAFQPEPARNAV